MKINGVTSVIEIALPNGVYIPLAGTTCELYAPDEKHPYWRLDEEGMDFSTLITEQGMVFKVKFKEESTEEASDGEDIPEEK